MPPRFKRPGAPRIGDALLRVRLRRQVIDHLGLLAPDQLGQLVLARLDQVEPLDPHALAQMRHVRRPLPRRRDPHHLVALRDQVLAQVPTHETRYARHQRSHAVETSMTDPCRFLNVRPLFTRHPPHSARYPSGGVTQDERAGDRGTIGSRAHAIDPSGIGPVPRDGLG